MSTLDANAWTSIAGGDLSGLEEAVRKLSKVTLLGSGRAMTGDQAATAFRSVRDYMPDLTVTGRIDQCKASVLIDWLEFRNLPWLPQEAISAVLRVSGSFAEVLGGLEPLLEQGLQSLNPGAATAAPSTLHPNALVLRAGYDDPPIHATLFTDEFVAHTPGRSPIAGDWQGPAPMAEHLSRIRALSGDTMSVQPLARFALANDGFGVVFSRATASRGPQKLDQYVCGVWRFDQGRIAEHWELVSDPEAWDTFWNLKTVT